MTLTAENAHSFLIAAGLLDPGAIVDGEYRAVSAARRNRNVRVTTRGYGGYLIKQPEQDADSRHSLRREIAFYQACARLEHAGELRPLLPRLAFGDLRAGVLVLELIEDALPLWGHYEASCHDELPVEAAEALGRVLAVLHGFGRAQPRHPALAFLPEEVPLGLKLHEPSPAMLSAVNAHAHQVLSMLQRDSGLAGRLAEVRALWTSETVIHGDVKLDNVLVRAGDDPDLARAGAVCLVDWELVQHGDPAWDVAGALHDFIVLWIMTLPSGPTVDAMLERERFPLSGMRPASRRLWQGYVDASGLDGAAAGRLLARAVAYTGARLVQSAFELAMSSPAMPPRTLLMLQVAANMWTDVATAGEELFGLEVAA